jgi:hypothetical protein
VSGHLIHFAAQPLRAANIIRTRCAWCGAMIEEVDLDRTAYTGDENPFVDEEGSPTGRWQGLVAIEAGNPTVKWALPDPEDGKIPSDSCMNIAAEITA